MAKNEPQTNLRLPADLKRELQASADREGRTFGGECIYRLQRSIRDGTAASIKREMAVGELRSAAKFAARLWELESRDADDDARLLEAIRDMQVWLRQLDKMEDEEMAAQRDLVSKLEKRVETIEAFVTKGPKAAKKVRDE